MPQRESDSSRKCHHYSDTLLVDRISRFGALRPAELAGLLRFEFDHSGKAEIEDELLRDYASGIGYRQTPASDLASGTRCGQDLHTFVNSMDIRKGPSHGARKSFFIE